MRLLILILVLFFGCKKNEPNVTYAGAIGVIYENPKRENLLDSKTIGALSDKDFTLYVMRNGIKSEILNAANSNLPGNFKIKNSTEFGNYLFLTFDVAQNTFNGNEQTYFIKTSDGLEDKITIKFNSKNEPTIALIELSINDQLKWSSLNSNNLPQFKIIRN